MVTNGEAQALVRRLVDAVWNGTDADVAPSLLADPEAALAWHRDRRTSFPDLAYTVVEVVADGDRVSWRWSATGTQRGAFGPVPPTGKRVEYAGATFARVDEEGLLTDVWSVNELFQLVTQLGATVTPPEPG